jgi:hypothetical protein
MEEGRKGESHIKANSERGKENKQYKTKKKQKKLS